MKTADNLAVRIIRLISQERSRALSLAPAIEIQVSFGNFSNPPAIWGKNASDIDLDPDIINDYFAEIATDPMYNKEHVIFVSRSRKEDSNAQRCPISYHRDLIEIMLAKMRKTSPGNDEIPYWVYRDCARELDLLGI